MHPVWLHTVHGLAVDVLFGTDNLYNWDTLIDVTAGTVFMRAIGVTLRGNVRAPVVPADPVLFAVSAPHRPLPGEVLRIVTWDTFCAAGGELN